MTRKRKPATPPEPTLADLPPEERERIIVEAALQLAKEQPGRFEVVEMPNGKHLVVIRGEPH